MKNVLTIVFTILLFQNAYSQIKFPVNDEGKVVYERVTKVDSATKESLYNKALDWIVLNYKSANDVIQLKDEQRCKIVGKGYFQVTHWMGNQWDVKHTLSIRTKDGRYKVQISQITFQTKTMKGVCANTFSMDDVKNGCLGKESFATLKGKAQDKIREIIIALETHLNTASIENDDDDW